MSGPVNLVRLIQLPDMVARPDLKFPSFHPALPVEITKANVKNADIFRTIAKHDILVHHPYQSFMPVLDFLQRPRTDPDVVAIKQTIYRTGSDSALMQSLLLAARSGKEVTAVVELMARFDEETNINWASQLEEVGAHVVYGVVGHKTHAKMVLVVRREVASDGTRVLRRYAHLGTGNYHSGTARVYTDFGLFTANEEMTADVHEIFQQLTGLGSAKKMKRIWQAPFSLHREHDRRDPHRSRDRGVRQAGAHHGADERAAGAGGDPRALRGEQRRRQDRPDRPRRLHAAAGREGTVGEHHGALDRRPLPRAQSHLLLPRRRRRRRLPVAAPTGWTATSFAASRSRSRSSTRS